MSLLGHFAIGVATARRITPADQPTEVLQSRMLVLATLAFLPDVDFLRQALAPSVPFLDHRAATHSLVFALWIGAFAAIYLIASGRSRPIEWALLATAVVASHGLLDSFGNTTLGVELFWPFSDARFLAPLHVLPSPSWQDLLTRRGLADLGVEFLIFIPFWIYAFYPRRRRPSLDDHQPGGGAPSTLRQHD
jgi:inner membrane protein